MTTRDAKRPPFARFSRDRRRKTAGFTLMEVLVALGVFLVGVGALGLFLARLRPSR